MQNDNLIQFTIPEGTCEQVIKLASIPQYEQRSEEWFDQRKNMITSSNLDAIFGRNKYEKRIDILFKKCGLQKPFTGNAATQHGCKYEDEAIQLYCRMFNKKSIDFGLIQHPDYTWIGGSPDGITTDGIVIEVKCPLYRKINFGEIPEHYQSQLKANMEICQLDKGVFIEYIPKHISRTRGPIINVVHMQRDPHWFEDHFDSLKGFWDDVLYYRDIGIESHPSYEKMITKINKASNKDDCDDLISKKSSLTSKTFHILTK